MPVRNVVVRVKCAKTRSTGSAGAVLLDAVFPSRRDEAAAPADPADVVRYSVISLIRCATCCAVGSGGADCMAISLVISPCTLILPAMNACMPA